MYASLPDQFRDAAAIQLPFDSTIPGVCMGMRDKPINLWHWKADWQADIDEGFRDVVQAYPNFWKDYYPFAVGTPPFNVPGSFASTDARSYLAGWVAGNPLSNPARLTPVEELAAAGFGTASHRTVQNVLGRGMWKDGKWRVVFSRPLAVGDTEAVQLRPGGRTFVAFAVWNGSNQEVGSRKQVTADTPLAIQAQPVAKIQPTPAPPGPVAPAPQVPAPQRVTWWVVLVIALASLSIGVAATAAVLAVKESRKGGRA
jgi:hypothetical protein